MMRSRCPDGTLEQALRDALELLGAIELNAGRPVTMWLTTHEAAQCSRARRRLQAQAGLHALVARKEATHIRHSAKVSDA